MSDRAHIVIVDDEPELREMVEEYLTKQGFKITAAEDGPTMRHIVAEQAVDLVLLDVKMPGEDGLSLARFLREHHPVGIIMLTAAGEVVDRIVGLEMGADDYISKPFDPRELLARVKSVLRRLHSRAEAAERATEPELVGIRFGKYVLNLESHQLFNTDGEEITITGMEFDLLKAFATHPNRVLTRDQILDLAHNRNWDPFDRSIDVRITRIRRKIEKDPAKPQIIKTVWGKGYLFVPDKEE
ncbi:MAG TPA: response regulator [Candidatus Competibacter sp.]|nr:DNA-binding response regulator [Candidatus Competibacteraceae bacterium]HRC73716.1 response regulator [Candidatus Competibacter sp.]